MKYNYRVNFVKGSAEKWNEYVKIFDNSAFYDQYLKGTENLKTWAYAPLKKGNVIVAETEKGEPVGLMVYDMNGMYGGFPYLSLIGVKEGFRGKGIGDRLIDIFVETSKQLGYEKAYITVSEYNPRAKSFFQKKGFKPLLIVPGLLKSGVGEWLLMKEL